MSQHQRFHISTRWLLSAASNVWPSFAIVCGSELDERFFDADIMRGKSLKDAKILWNNLREVFKSMWITSLAKQRAKVYSRHIIPKKDFSTWAQNHRFKRFLPRRRKFLSNMKFLFFNPNILISIHFLEGDVPRLHGKLFFLHLRRTWPIKTVSKLEMEKSQHFFVLILESLHIPKKRIFFIFFHCYSPKQHVHRTILFPYS